ncbi:hypothetical protein JCM11641_000963 [Rhodosporidiobolus odoratus]
MYLVPLYFQFFRSPSSRSSSFFSRGYKPPTDRLKKSRRAPASKDVVPSAQLDLSGKKVDPKGKKEEPGKAKQLASGFKESLTTFF